MQHKKRVSLAMTLLVAAGPGCTLGPHGPLSGWTSHRSSLSAEEMASSLAEVSSLAPEAVPAAIARLEDGAAAGSAQDRLKLAYLLGRFDAPTSDPDRATEILRGLSPAFQDKRAQEIARLLGRTLTLERELSLAHSRTAELQQQIEQLKGLERELEDRSRTIEPLPNAPGEPHSGDGAPAQTPSAVTPGGPSP
jgi:hypothetical protein